MAGMGAAAAGLMRENDETRDPIRAHRHSALYGAGARWPPIRSATLAELGRIGYREVELAGYAGRTPAQLRSALDAAGLNAVSSHVAIERLRDDLDRLIDECGVLGVRYLVAPDVSGTSLDAYRAGIDVLNRAAERAAKTGVRIGYHNHESELALVDGVRPYDLLIERTDSRVLLEMDVYWLVLGGGDPLCVLRQISGRWRMAHLKDMTAARTMTDVGSGVIDWPAIIRAARAAGVRHWFVRAR